MAQNKFERPKSHAIQIKGINSIIKHKKTKKETNSITIKLLVGVRPQISAFYLKNCSIKYLFRQLSKEKFGVGVCVIEERNHKYTNSHYQLNASSQSSFFQNGGNI